MNYVIVTAKCAGELEIKVRAKIRDGFEPLGGACVAWPPGMSAWTKGSYQTWAQAMIRKPVI
jgi:hypothetical protein